MKEVKNTNYLEKGNTENWRCSYLLYSADNIFFYYFHLQYLRSYVSGSVFNIWLGFYLIPTTWLLYHFIAEIWKLWDIIFLSPGKGPVRSPCSLISTFAFALGPQQSFKWYLKYTELKILSQCQSPMLVRNYGNLCSIFSFLTFSWNFTTYFWWL